MANHLQKYGALRTCFCIIQIPRLNIADFVRYI